MAPKKAYKDEWQTASREGYEDRGAFRPPRAPRRQPGSSALRTLGGATIVGGILWGIYLATKNTDVLAALRDNHGPLAIVGMGVVCYLLGKYLRL